MAAQADQVDAFKSRVSAMFKLIVSGRVIDPSLRSSAHTLSCPGDDDCSHSCARTCSEQHLSSLKAFSVTGESATRLVPSAPPPSPPSPYPPSPPRVPFTECANTCNLGLELESVCRDGGHGSVIPALCPFSTQCSVCGFRQDVAEAEQDDSCETAINNACEDGGTGSVHFVDSEGHEAYRCGFGTDKTDCESLGPRYITTRSDASFTGTTNFTSPLPPPPLPTPPSPPSSPPTDLVNFQGCVSFGADSEVCHAFFDRSGNFLCSGTEDQINRKHEKNVCSHGYSDYSSSTAFDDVCSDGGYDSRVIRNGNVTYEASTFACNYGSQCIFKNVLGTATSGSCGRERPKKLFVDCENECGIDANRPSDVAGTGDSLTTTDANGVTTGKVYCRDGGIDSKSAHCAYGTQVRTPFRPFTFLLLIVLFCCRSV